jgi:pimeloyl-ACP methyl ester carboxylesterase
MAGAPIILVPGFWLGAWAWDGVFARLRASGHDVAALTLPGLESLEADRSAITLQDHVDAVVAAVRRVGRPVVLAVHSGAGGAGYAASDRVPDLIAAMVYVDSGPATGGVFPDFEGAEMPLPSWEEMAQDPGNSLEGVSPEQREAFRSRAVPEPGNVVRGAPVLTNAARLDIPTTVICTTFPSEQIRQAVAEGVEWVAGLAELKKVTYVDLPTSHWAMWSRPDDLAAILAGVAAAHAT